MRHDVAMCSRVSAKAGLIQLGLFALQDVQFAVEIVFGQMIDVVVVCAGAGGR